MSSVPPEEFFRGTTQAGRTLVLSYENIAYTTVTDATGVIVDNPSETKMTATLDGAPIEVEAVNWSGSTAAVRSAELGTFTATSTDYAEDHTAALRRYLEHRPSGGYDVSIVEKAQLGDQASYMVGISNGRLTERAEFRLSPQVMSTLARGAEQPTDEQVLHEISHQVRRDSWEKIKNRAEHPTSIAWLAHPS